MPTQFQNAESVEQSIRAYHKFIDSVFAEKDCPVLLEVYADDIDINEVFTTYLVRVSCEKEKVASKEALFTLPSAYANRGVGSSISIALAPPTPYEAPVAGSESPMNINWDLVLEWEEVPQPASVSEAFQLPSEEEVRGIDIDDFLESLRDSTNEPRAAVVLDPERKGVRIGGHDTDPDSACLDQEHEDQ